MLDVPVARTLERMAPAKIVDQDCTVFRGKDEVDTETAAVAQKLTTAQGLVADEQPMV